MKKSITSVVTLIALMSATSVQAAYDLQVTEIWFGQEGTDLTEDWFEITNFGDTSWTTADGNLYFDDESADLADAELMSGISEIAPGESVVYVGGGASSTFVFHTVWDPVKSGFQVGYHSGSGLSQSGDAVNVWIGGPSGAADAFGAYGNTNGFSGQSWDLTLDTFSTVGNAAGAVATIALGGSSGLEPAIASPGSTAIPEPSTLVLGGLILFGMCVSRKR